MFNMSRNMLNRLMNPFHGKRNMYEILGYNHNPTLQEYYHRYNTQDIANRIINAYPEAIWTKIPDVREDLDKQNDTEFEKQFKRLRERTNMFHFLNRADKLCCLGEYSVLFIGVRDGRALDRPIGEVKGIEDILYITPYDQDNAVIDEFDEDINSERYGLPLIYSITTGGYATASHVNMTKKTFKVHHSRIIHIAEGTLTNDLIGIPRLRPVLNRLYDLEKVVGGVAEILWLNGRGAMAFTSKDGAPIDNNPQAVEAIKDFSNQLSRIISVSGMEIQPIEFKTPSPEGIFDVIISLIAAATGIPRRILTGSERGQLASTQDQNNWFEKVKERRDSFCEPMILKVLIDKFISIGALPFVTDYEIVWPDLIPASEKDIADVAVKKSIAALNHIKGIQMGHQVLTDQQIVEDILNMPFQEREINSINEELKNSLEKDSPQEEVIVQEEESSEEN